MSFLPSLEGTISAKPIAGALEGALRGSVSAPTAGGSAHHRWEISGSLQNSAVAEVGNLISSIGSLSAQAQGLPLSPPTLPGLPQSQSYKPQATDYTQFSDDSN